MAGLGGRRRSGGLGAWNVISALSGLVLAQASFPFVALLAQWALLAVVGLILGGLSVVAWRRSRRRSWLWRPHRHDNGGEFAKQMYWLLVSLLLGLATPQLLALVSDSFAAGAGVVAGLLLAGEMVSSALDWVYRSRTRRRWPPTRNPYPLLTPYSKDRATVFYGREDEVARLSARIRDSTSWLDRFIPVVGPSGCGKSSLIHAGVLSEIDRAQALWPFWRRTGYLAPFTPGIRPVEALARAVQTSASNGASEFVAKVLAEAKSIAHSAEAGSQGPPPKTLLRMLARRRRWNRRILLFVDQLEEAAQSERADLHAFLCILKAVLQYDGRLVVIATIRSDMVGQMLGGAAADLFNHSENVTPMDRSQLRRVITGPAESAGVALENGLDDAMLADAQGADVLPLLGFVLHHLWAGPAISDGLITKDEYRAEMGPTNAMSRRAGAVLEQLVNGPLSYLPREDAERLVLDTLLEAVNLNGSEPVRRRFKRVDLSEEQQAVVDEFASPDVRLLTLDRTWGDVTVEIAHEAVLRNWSALTGRIEDNRQLLSLRWKLEPRAREWAESGQDPGLLLRGVDLKDVLDMREQVLTNRERSRVTLEVGEVGRLIAASIESDNEGAEHRADAAAVQALLAVDPPRPVKDVELAMQLALASTEIKATPRSRFALYRSWCEGMRGTLAGHGEGAPEAAWSPDGRLLATVGDSPIRLWTPEGQLVYEIADSGGGASLAWSPDGRALACAHYGDDDGIRLWAPDGRLVQEIDFGARRVAWSPDGRLLASAAYENGDVFLWSPNGQFVGELEGHDSAVQALVWSPQGRLLASADEGGNVLLWLPDGRLLHELPSDNDRMTLLAPSWSPDGRLLATGSDHAVRLWSSDGQLLHELTGHKDRVRTLDWSPDGRLLASGSDLILRMWSSDGQLVHELSGHDNSVGAVAWSPDGRLLASAEDFMEDVPGVVRLWSPDGQLMHEMSGHTGGVSNLAWSPDGRVLVSASSDGTVRLWSPDGRLARGLNGHNGRSREIAWSPDGLFLASIDDDSLLLWSSDGELVHRFNDYDVVPEDLAWSPAGRLLACHNSRDCTIRLWPSGVQFVHDMAREDDRLGVLAWSPDGGLLASGGQDGTVLLWSPDGQRLYRLAGPTAAVRTIAWSPDGRLLASSGDDSAVRLWSRDGQLVNELHGHSYIVRTVAWSPDGRLLASAGDNMTTRLWSLDGQLLWEVTRNGGGGSRVAWSPDGRLLAVSTYDDHTMRLWSPDGQLLYELPGHNGGVSDMAWSPDGRLLAASSYEDRTVRLWSPDGQLLYEVTGHSGGINALAWSPDARLLASAAEDPTVRLWPGPHDFAELLMHARGVPGLRPLTTNERRRAGLSPMSSSVPAAAS